MPVQVSNNLTFTIRLESKAIENGFRVWNVVPPTQEEESHIMENMDAKWGMVN